MAAGRPPSPITEALFNSLRILRQGDVGRGASQTTANQLVLSYSNPHDFNFMWRLWDDVRAGGDNEVSRDCETGDGFNCWVRAGGVFKNVILIWDGLPSPSVIGGVDLANFVTPYDWVVALGLILFTDNSTVTKDLGLRVTIVDLFSNGESERLFRRVQGNDNPLMPWVRVYRPKPASSGGGGIAHLLVDHLLLPFRTSSSAFYDGSGPTDKSDWELIRRVWSAKLLAPAEPRDRHAIANLVGPQILLSSMRSPDASADPHGPACLHALLALMRALGLIHTGLKNTVAPWVGPEEWIPARRSTETAVFLLDDMHALGWAEFLSLALGIGGREGHRNFFVWDRPDAKQFGLLGNLSLVDMLEDDNCRLRVNKGINLRPKAAGAILCLDLRLFSQRSQEEEFAFYARLLSLARQAVEEDNRSRAGLPWRGFTGREINAVEACIERRESESEGYLVALTLLPRLIALVDPMLPIILFSSTGQRLVIELLRDYGNIITDFDKPRFFGGLKGEVVEETLGRFLCAFSKALRLLEGRRVCKSFSSPPAGPRISSPQPYVEIYLDESDDVSNPQFRVGGLALIFDSEGQAQRLNEEMVRMGLVWGSTDVDDKPVKCLPKQGWPAADYEKYIFRPVGRILDALGVPLAFGLSLSAPPDLKWTDSTDLTNPSCLDNIYRYLVVKMLETLFFEVIPGKLNQIVPNFRCGVFIANRTRHQSDADPPAAWDQTRRGNMTWRFGVKVKQDRKGRLYFNSVTSETAYPMVAQVRALQPEADIRVAYARGSHLIYGINTSYPESLPRPVHLLADLVVRFSRNPGALGLQPTLRTWLKNGFSAVADESFEAALRACRHARAGRNVEAIVEALAGGDRGRGTGRVATWALLRIARSVTSLTGREFVALSSRLQ